MVTSEKPVKPVKKTFKEFLSLESPNGSMQVCELLNSRQRKYLHTHTKKKNGGGGGGGSAARQMLPQAFWQDKRKQGNEERGCAYLHCVMMRVNAA